MNKLIIAVALCAALAACKKDDAAPADTTVPATDTAAAPADAAATPAADAAAAPATDAAAPAQAGLPQACEDYINRVKACVAKSGGDAAASQFQATLDQNKAQWEAVADKTVVAAQCTQANDMFAQQAAVMKCD